VLILGRIALGLAIGVASYTAPLYIGEMAPPKLRGGLVTLNQLAITVGILVAYIIDAAFASSGNWRLMFGFGVLPALALGLGIAVLPESPRWLLLHQHKQEALKVLSLAGLWFCWRFVPETKGVPLERIERDLRAGRPLRKLGAG
jgi:MFS transporter, SP family, galactose:H+ symporter